MGLILVILFYLIHLFLSLPPGVGFEEILKGNREKSVHSVYSNTSFGERPPVGRF